MSLDQKPQPELIPYASHVAHGTGRTPIGIMLFACSHLLLGAVLAYLMLAVISRYAVVARYQVFFRIMMTGASAMMILGGVALLLKGRTAWICSVLSFAALALFEAGLAGATAHWSATNRYPSTGVGMVLITTSMFALCMIVLGYLGSSKARDLFALPPGETPVVIRQLPRIAIAVFLLAVILGGSIGRSP